MSKYSLNNIAVGLGKFMFNCKEVYTSGNNLYCIKSIEQNEKTPKPSNHNNNEKEKKKNLDSMEKLLYDLTQGKIKAEKHYVYTLDGYRLNIYRIVHSNKNIYHKEKNKKKEVFCLNHGLFESSINYTCKGYNSLAFQIFANNYDVWICNNRGNSFTKYVGKKNALKKLFKKYSSEDLKDLGFNFSSYVSKNVNKEMRNKTKKTKKNDEENYNKEYSEHSSFSNENILNNKIYGPIQKKKKVKNKLIEHSKYPTKNMKRNNSECIHELSTFEIDEKVCDKNYYDGESELSHNLKKSNSYCNYFTKYNSKSTNNYSDSDNKRNRLSKKYFKFNSLLNFIPGFKDNNNNDINNRQGEETKSLSRSQTNNTFVNGSSKKYNFIGSDLTSSSSTFPFDSSLNFNKTFYNSKNLKGYENEINFISTKEQYKATENYINFLNEKKLEEYDKEEVEEEEEEEEDDDLNEDEISNQEKFKWTFEDMSTKDLPSIIKYIKNETKKDKIIFVGFSQGSIQLLISSCLNEYVNNSIKRCYLMSLPIILRSKYDLLKSMKLLLLLSKCLNAFLRGKKFIQNILPYKISAYLISSAAHIITHNLLKYYNENIDSKDKKIFFLHTPNGGTSKANLNKWIESFNSYPVTDIIEKYSHKCLYPITLIYGNEDTIVDTQKSINYMKKIYKNNLKIISISKWSHLDPLWSDNKKMVISYILKDLQKNQK
ncbi:steryl ester hydrolase, putative [Plasmodium relictum]|uniref:Steryl ester hydrolase, putative n=1 Tax=Plasmodium relictum TaxID=85471 RepID=A0A1J1H9M4_PLARL|nr:steryl ester hydrolase, putative [Plasmodium relictum]CRH00136.1 steryl ester hydrolase, putative [Plasmodium relictum]